MSDHGADSPDSPAPPTAHDEPAATNEAAEHPAVAPSFDPVSWGAVALGILVGLLVAVAFLAAASSAY